MKVASLELKVRGCEWIEGGGLQVGMSLEVFKGSCEIAHMGT